MRNIDNGDVYFSDMLLIFAIGILLGFFFGIVQLKFLSLGFGCIALFFSFSILRRGIK